MAELATIARPYADALFQVVNFPQEHSLNSSHAVGRSKRKAFHNKKPPRMYGRSPLQNRAHHFWPEPSAPRSPKPKS
jgi:hypothetical protein